MESHKFFRKLLKIKKSFKIMYGDQMCQEPLFSYSYVAVFVIASSMPESNTLIQNARPMKTIRDPKYNNHVLFLPFGKCI